MAIAGSAPPIRSVTDAEVARHLPLVHHTLSRLFRQGQLTPDMEYDDCFAVGSWAVWEALRRWKPEKGTQSTYLSSYIWGYVMKHQRDTTRAKGWNQNLGRRIADVCSYEETIVEDFTLLETLAAPDDTEDAAYWSARLDALHERVAAMRPVERAIGEHILAGEPLNTLQLSERFALSRQRINQIVHVVRSKLAAAEGKTSPRRGVLLVDRTLHQDERAARREAARIHPGCTVLDITKRKVRQGGRVTSAQGRPSADGRLGRPVWAIELEAA